MGQKGVYFITSHEDGDFDDISCLDLAAGTVKHHLVKYQGRSDELQLDCIGKHTPCSDVATYQTSRNDPIANGIYVYDIDEAYSQQKQFFVVNTIPSHRQAMLQALLLLLVDSHIDVFKLENGTLSRTATFAIPLNLMSLAVLHVTKSQVVLGQ